MSEDESSGIRTRAFVSERYSETKSECSAIVGHDACARLIPVNGESCRARQIGAESLHREDRQRDENHHDDELSHLKWRLGLCRGSAFREGTFGKSCAIHTKTFRCNAIAADIT